MRYRQPNALTIGEDMEEKRSITAPTVGEAVSMSLSRLGKTLFNYPIVFVIVCVFGYVAVALMMMADVAWALVAAILVLYTLGALWFLKTILFL